jgi:hypothetical protein
MTNQPTITNHRWGDRKPQSPYLTLRVCVKCGIQKESHHQDREHWETFRGQDGRLIETVGGGTPPCFAGRMKVAA